MNFPREARTAIQNSRFKIQDQQTARRFVWASKKGAGKLGGSRFKTNKVHHGALGQTKIGRRSEQGFKIQDQQTARRFVWASKKGAGKPAVIQHSRFKI
jgi:hypothetical protein